MLRTATVAITSFLPYLISSQSTLPVGSCFSFQSSSGNPNCIQAVSNFQLLFLSAHMSVCKSIKRPFGKFCCLLFLRSVELSCFLLQKLLGLVGSIRLMSAAFPLIEFTQIRWRNLSSSIVPVLGLRDFLK